MSVAMWYMLAPGWVQALERRVGAQRTKGGSGPTEPPIQVTRCINKLS